MIAKEMPIVTCQKLDFDPIREYTCDPIVGGESILLQDILSEAFASKPNATSILYDEVE